MKSKNKFYKEKKNAWKLTNAGWLDFFLTFLMQLVHIVQKSELVRRKV